MLRSPQAVGTTAENNGSADKAGSARCRFHLSKNAATRRDHQAPLAVKNVLSNGYFQGIDGVGIKVLRPFATQAADRDNRPLLKAVGTQFKKRLSRTGQGGQRRDPGQAKNGCC
jgi:hypothetical protein